MFTAALLAGVLFLLARPKVVADECGVTVVNIVSRRRLDWAEILRVNLRPGDPWVFLDLSDGTSLPALGIQPGIAKQQAIADARPCGPSPRPAPPPDPRHPGTDSGAPRDRLSGKRRRRPPAAVAHVLINLVAEARRPRLRPCRPARSPGAPATRGVTLSGDGRIVL
ncbi:hypothetical protein SHKM778_62090 [Streptomyces sp. KM77-8]|uniref:Low molecular weight protein antigen 6 PH domain-containing protein n=1 Tax=Streptomyces haneummycinicus TaxID=3074435 RepID=A0AAT9HQT2_9ACTN